MKGKKGLKWMGSTFAALCILLLGSTTQSCDEAATSVTSAPVVEAVSTTETPDDPIAGKSMILVQAFDAATKTTYTFDGNNPEDRFLLVPSTLRNGHIAQASDQNVKTAGREFTERFFETAIKTEQSLHGPSYQITDESGNTLWFQEWNGAPLFAEADLLNEKGAALANTQIICYWEWILEGYTSCWHQQPDGHLTWGLCPIWIRQYYCYPLPDLMGHF